MIVAVPMLKREKETGRSTDCVEEPVSFRRG